MIPLFSLFQMWLWDYFTGALKYLGKFIVGIADQFESESIPSMKKYFSSSSNPQEYTQLHDNIKKFSSEICNGLYLWINFICLICIFISVR